MVSPGGSCISSFRRKEEANGYRRCILVSTTMSFHVWRQGRASPSLSAMLSTAFPTTGLIIDTWDIARNLGITGLPSGVRWLDIVGIVLLFVWILAYVAGIAGITNKIWKGRLLWEGMDDVSSVAPTRAH